MLIVVRKFFPPITKTIQVRQTRHAGFCWRSRDELISDILLWTPSHWWEKVGRLARTYVQLLCADTGSSLEDLPEATDNREGWRKMVKEIRAGGTTWWWWWWWWWWWLTCGLHWSSRGGKSLCRTLLIIQADINCVVISYDSFLS